MYLVKTEDAGVLESEEVICDTRWEVRWLPDITADGDYTLFGSTNSTPDNDYDWLLAVVEGSDITTGVEDVPFPAELRLTASPNPIRSHTRLFFKLPAHRRGKRRVLRRAGFRASAGLQLGVGSY